MDPSPQTDALLAALLDLTDDGVIVVSSTGDVLALNQAARTMLGLDHPPTQLASNPEQTATFDVDGRPVPPTETPIVRALRGARVPPTELRVRRPDGTELRALCRATPAHGALGQVIGAVGIFVDLAPREAYATALRQGEERYRSLTELVSDYTYELSVDEERRLHPTWVTDAFEAVTGYSLEDLALHGGLKALVLPTDHNVLRRQLKAVLAGHDHACELRIRTRRDEVRWMRSFARPVLDPVEGRVVRILGAARDISDEKLLSPLTGLPNLVAFKDRVEVALDHLQRRPGQLVAVLYIDLDHFHVVNHGFGYATGDVLLRAYADRISTAGRPGDSAAHLRGDEFSALLTDLRHPDDAMELAEALVEKIAAPVHLDGTQVVVTASVGVAFSEDHSADPDELMRRAQTAASRARALGGARVEVYDPALLVAMQERVRLESALRGAMAEERLEVHYQPIVSLHNGQLRGFEALLRWNDPVHGRVDPASFVAVAEETGLIIELGAFVLRQACERLARWARLHPELSTLSLSVNLSPLQVGRGDLLYRLDRVLRRTGVAPARLRLEITESTLMRDPDGAIELLDQVRGRGVRVGVDDFGTGHSSLSLLHRFPVDSLKIDRSFVSGLDQDGPAAGIVSTIVALGRHLGLELIAEGIERPEQAAALTALGVTLGQGFLYSAALTPDEADAMVSALAQAGL